MPILTLLTNKTEHKPKFNFAQKDFFRTLLPDEFTPSDTSKEETRGNDLDDSLGSMHKIHQASRVRAQTVAYQDYLKTEHRPRIRVRIKDLQARGIIPTKAEKGFKLRKVDFPTFLFVLNKLGLTDTVKEKGYTSEIIAKIKAEAPKLNIKAETKELELVCNYLLWLRRKQKNRKNTVLPSGV